MGTEYVELSTKSGKLRGLVKTSGLDKKNYQSFQGIPYAKPPVGELRFKPPVPFGPWEGVRDTLKEGDECIQKHMLFGTPVGTEDCLYLNVYTAQAGKTDAKRAVMVWIHGGGFARGSGSSEIYGPEYLIEEDIVLVTINYRCGVFGFLSLDNEALPGNNGLKDQTLALKWVQDHIDSFGGDPNNVTLFGESAGGASVHYHMLSSLSKGLFHKAILQSGSSLSQWAFQLNPKEKTFLLAKELGCTSEDPDKVLEFLKSIPAIDLVRVQDKETLPTDKEYIQKFQLLFLPSVEKTGGAARFLPDTPRRLLERGEFNKVPVILGATDKEGMLALALKEIQCEKVNGNKSLMVPSDLAIESPEEELKLGKEILQFYTNSETLSWDVIDGYIDFVTDVGFAVGLENTRQYFFKHNLKPVYFYLFTYTSLRAFSNFLIPMSYPEHAAKFVGTGASHGDELVHLFKTNMALAPILPPTPEDQAFMKKFLKAWTTFAKTGNPNCKELGKTWKEDSLNNPSFLELGKEIKAIDGSAFPKRMTFWKNVYAKHPVSF